jgi:hypothetical protein
MEKGASLLHISTHCWKVITDNLTFVITQSLMQQGGLTKERWVKGSFVLVETEFLFFKDVTLEWHFNRRKNILLTWCGNIVWPIEQILHHKLRQTCQWCPSWRIYSNPCMFIFQAPLNAIWNSLNLWNHGKKDLRFWKMLRFNGFQCWNLWSMFWQNTLMLIVKMS